MSNTQRAAVALRFTIVGGASSPHEDSLVGLSTTELPDGAQAFVVATKAYYYLDKTAAQTSPPAGAIVPTVGPGLWIFSGATAPAETWASVDGTVDFSATGTRAVVQNVWHAMPDPGEGGGDFYELFGPGPWTLDTDTGVIHYHGPSGKSFLVTAIASAWCGTASQAVEFNLTVNGDEIGTTAVEQTSARATLGNSPTTAETGLSHSLIVTLDNGDTLQHMFRNVTATPGAVGFTYYSVSITAV
jgi:hypothetical protein